MKDIDGILMLRGQAAGAIANGTRVKKVWGEPGDAHSLGAGAVVLGSIADPASGIIVYCVEWDDAPGLPTIVQAKKIGPA